MKTKFKTALGGAVMLAALSAGVLSTNVQARDGEKHDMAMPGAVTHGPITVSGAWARPTIAKMKITAAYFSAAFDGDGTDKLIGAKTPVAEKAELHEHIMEGDVAKMRPVDGVDLSAGKPVLFKPGGYHVMIMGVKNPPLKEGMTFPLTLTFEKAGDVTVTVMVTKKGGGMDHGHMDHGQHK